MKKILLILFPLLLIACAKIYFFGLSKPVIRIKSNGFVDGVDIANLSFIKKLEEDYELRFVKFWPDLHLTSTLISEKKIKKYQHLPKIHWTGEASIGNIEARLKDHDLVLGFDFFENKNYIRYPLYYDQYREKLNVEHEIDRGKCNPNGKKYFACFLVSNSGRFDERFDAARERALIFHKLSAYKFVASAGKYLRNLTDDFPDESVDLREDWLKNCKFVISYENQYYPGYITEKLFQAWLAGAVPIYSGHVSVKSDFNAKAFIFRPDFASDEEIIDYIKFLDADDGKYCQMWNQDIRQGLSPTYQEISKQINLKIKEIIRQKIGK